MDRGAAIRIVGGGCFINVALTGLLVGLFSAARSFSINAIVLPFLGGATISFALSLFIVRRSNDVEGVIRRALLAGVGVLLGSVAAVLGVAAFLLLAGA